MILGSRPGGRPLVLGDMVAGKPEGNTHQGRGGAGCELFWHLQENSSFCRNVEVKGGIMMGRLITESQDGFCEAKQKKVTVTLIKEAIVGGDSLVPFDYVDKPPKCLEREQNGCNFLGKPNCLLRRLLNK